jgi:hypothetical protein
MNQPETMLQQNELHYTLVHEPDDDQEAGGATSQTFDSTT